MKPEKRNIEVLDEQMVVVLKNKTPSERLMMAFKMWDFAKKELTNYLRLQYPLWDENKIHHEVVKRLSHGSI